MLARQRAAELQTGEREIGEELSEEQVLALGREVGIPARYLQQALLEERVRAEPLIELRYGHALESLTQDDDGVSTQDGIRATHCIAADGVHSGVRQLLGIPFEGFSFDDRFIIADVRVDLDFATPERRFYFDPPWNPGRQVLLHPQPKGVWRIDWQVAEDVQLTDDHIRAIVGDKPYEVVWQSTYRFHQRRAKTFRQGRILLAGDAAHVMSPFGARGLNSGICDADNAAWKIAADRRGEAGPGLLASYDVERGAAADENLRITGDTMRFLVPGTPEERERRRKALESGEGIDSGKLFTPFAYTDSPLTTDGGELITGSRAAGPGFTVVGGRVIRPDGHVAGEDSFSSKAAQAELFAALSDRANITLHLYPGRDHAFARPGGEHWHAADAALANQRTADFLKKNLA